MLRRTPSNTAVMTGSPSCSKACVAMVTTYHCVRYRVNTTRMWQADEMQRARRVMMVCNSNVPVTAQRTAAAWNIDVTLQPFPPLSSPVHRPAAASQGSPIQTRVQSTKATSSCPPTVNVPLETAPDVQCTYVGHHCKTSQCHSHTTATSHTHAPVEYAAAVNDATDQLCC